MAGSSSTLNLASGNFAFTPIREEKRLEKKRDTTPTQAAMGYKKQKTETKTGGQQQKGH
jgi:hypothetical protein